jgi:hypothetical protein
MLFEILHSKEVLKGELAATGDWTVAIVGRRAAAGPRHSRASTTVDATYGYYQSCRTAHRPSPSTGRCDWTEMAALR